MEVFIVVAAFIAAILWAWLIRDGLGLDTLLFDPKGAGAIFLVLWGAVLLTELAVVELVRRIISFVTGAPYVLVLLIPLAIVASRLMRQWRGGRIDFDL